MISKADLSQIRVVIREEMNGIHGKVNGMRAEMNDRFEAVQDSLKFLNEKISHDVTELRFEMNSRFTAQDQVHDEILNVVGVELVDHDLRLGVLEKHMA